MRDDLVRILFDAVADDVEVVFGDSCVQCFRRTVRGSAVEFEHGAPREVDVVVGADGQHSALRELAFGPERRFTHHLGAYLSIYTVDNVLGLRDRQCSTTNRAGPRRCSRCAATNAPRWCCCFAARPLDVDFGTPPPTTSCCVGDSPGWVGRQGVLLGGNARRVRLLLRRDEPGAAAALVDRSGGAARRRRIRTVADVGPRHLAGIDRRLSTRQPLATAADPASAFALWERGFRPNVEPNQSLATDGMSTLLPAFPARHLRPQPDDAGDAVAGTVRPRLRRPYRTRVASGHPDRLRGDR